MNFPIIYFNYIMNVNWNLTTQPRASRKPEWTASPPMATAPLPRTHRIHWVMPLRPHMFKESPPLPQQVAWCSCLCSSELTAGHPLFKTQFKCPLRRGPSEDTADDPPSMSSLPKSLLSFLPRTYSAPIPQSLPGVWHIVCAP